MLRVLLKPRAHGLSFCALHHTALSYRTLVSQFTEDRNKVASKQKDSVSESRVGEVLENQSVFERSMSSMYSVCTVRNN